MSSRGSDLRQRSGRIRWKISRKEIVPAMSQLSAVMDWPEWLPEDWTMKLKKRSNSCHSRNRIDRYYICPLSGKKLRSRLEVMRFLNIKVPDRPASSSRVVVGERPEWLPEGWSVEFRKRRASNIVDKYYICPLSGIKLRSKLEVMRFLNNKMLDCPASTSGSAPRGEGYKQLVQFDHSPTGLPDGWVKETRLRKNGGRADSYYISPINGYGFRSKKDVFRYLKSEEVSRIAFRQKRTHTPDAYTLKEEFLPIIGLKKSKVKRTVVRRRLFARKEPISNASTDIKFANPSQKPALSPLGHSSALLEDSAAEISSAMPANIGHMAQSIFQIEWQPNPAFHGEEFQGQPAIKMLPGPVNEKLSLMQLEDKRLPVLDATLSEEKQLELTKKQSQPERHRIGEEFQERPTRILREPGNEKLSEPLMQLEGKKHQIPDSNVSEEEEFELTKKLSQLKRRGKPTRHGVGEELKGQSAIKFPREPGNENISESLMQLEGKRWPDANLLVEKQFELTQKQSQPRRRDIGELQGQPAIKMLLGPGNEKLPLVQLEGERLPVLDANLSQEKQLELTKKQSQPRRHSIGEELQEYPATKILREAGNEKLSERREVQDPNVSEEKEFELIKKLSQLRRCSKPKRLAIGERLQGQSTIKVPQKPGNGMLLESMMQLEGLPVPDANLSVEKQFQLTQKQSQPKGRGGIGELQGQPEIKVLPGAGNEKLLEPLMQLESNRLPVPNVHLSEEEQFEMNQKLSQLKKRNHVKRRGIGEQLQGQPVIKILQEHGNEKLSEPMMQPEGEILPVRDANLSGKKQFEPIKKLSQLKRRDSRNTGAIRSVNNQPSLRKRKAEKTDTESVRVLKRLAGVPIHPASKSGTGNQSRRAKPRQIEQPQSTAAIKTDTSCWLHQNDVSLTDELQEKLEHLKPFTEQASQEEQADQPQPTVPKDTKAGCLSHEKDTLITNELQERLEKLKLFVEQASVNQHAGQPQLTVPKDLDASCWSHQKDTPETEELRKKLKRLKPFSEQASKEQPVHALATLPFGDFWLDPCIEFAFKTLTSDLSVLEDVAAIQDYFSHQLISSQSLDASAGSIPLDINGTYLGNGKVNKDCQQIWGVHR